MHRRRIKALKRAEQGGLCAICRKPLPERDCILDRLEAMRGYTVENTRLLCRECDFKVQRDECAEPISYRSLIFVWANSASSEYLFRA